METRTSHPAILDGLWSGILRKSSPLRPSTS
jgi:hypothetical protein